MSTNRILIFGATGRTGSLILEEALNQGYKLNCLLRNPKNIKRTHENLKIFQGSPQYLPDLENAIHGCTTVISSLNISRKTDFPWSSLRTPPTFLSEVAKNILEASKTNRIERLIVCSAWGVSETKKDIPWWFKWLIENSNIGIAYKDHERQENRIKSSGLNWTIVRPTGLTNFKRERKIIESFNNIPKPKLTISRINVARYIVNAISKKALIRKTPVISEL